MYTQRYLHEYNASDESLAEIAVTMRKHAANNPEAMFYQKPMTKENYFSSPFIVEPLRQYDSSIETDGGCAFVITSAERAKDMPHPPAVIRSVAQGSAYDQEVMTSFYRSSISSFPEYELVAKECYQHSGLSANDIDAASFYDPFTSAVLFQLESFGFCKQGEAHEFVKDGNLGLDGQLPCNTSGGQLSEAHLQGINGVTEAVRLIRGTSVNQPKKNDHVLATSGFGVPASAMILGK
jgi:acetyl-CoA acetyltransferase